MELASAIAVGSPEQRSLVIPIEYLITIAIAVAVAILIVYLLLGEKEQLTSKRY
jgi:hypothetical protein